MRTIETTHQFIFQSEDENGKYELRIHKDGSQIQLESGIDDYSNEAFVSTDKSELKAIRDMINKILEEQQ